MRAQEFTTLNEAAATELAKRLPSLAKHDYNTIDDLMRKIATKHRITSSALHDLFVRKYKKTPDSWANKLDKLHEEGDETTTDYGSQPIVQEFIQWSKHVLKLESDPEVEFSYDTEEAQEGHHTGRHTEGDNSVWVYVANRNMVDVFRTVFHELVHVRQGELNMIKPGSSYPGSPIEAEADIMAGKYIKIFGKAHPEIFQ
jgi:hypothetical protein